MSNEILFFGGFILFIILILSIDLGLISKNNHVVKFREALGWTILWVSLSLALYFFIRHHGDLLHNINDQQHLNEIVEKFKHPIDNNAVNFEQNLEEYNKNLALEYITGYLIEYSLSVDNIFVIILIFMAFGVNKKYYHRVLFWGILGAIILRFIFIFISAALIQNFYWILYVFGAFLIFTGIKLFISRNKHDNIDPQKHPVVKFASKYFRVYPRYVGNHFFIHKDKKRFITPLFIVLLVVEFSDVLFAVDSVPAIFAVTSDPFIVFFSNIFAIIGLRSLFFLLVNVMNLFSYLKEGLSILLTFIGFKMVFHHWLKDFGFTTMHSLYIIVGILTITIIVSLLFPKNEILKK